MEYCLGSASDLIEGKWIKNQVVTHQTAFLIPADPAETICFSFPLATDEYTKLIMTISHYYEIFCR